MNTYGYTFISLLMTFGRHIFARDFLDRTQIIIIILLLKSNKHKRFDFAPKIYQQSSLYFKSNYFEMYTFLIGLHRLYYIHTKTKF